MTTIRKGRRQNSRKFVLWEAIISSRDQHLHTHALFASLSFVRFWGLVVHQVSLSEETVYHLVLTTVGFTRFLAKGMSVPPA